MSVVNQDIELKILDNRIIEWSGVPKYQTDGAAAIDLYACIDKDILLHPGETILISSGISVHINNPNIAAVILPRSGLGNKGLVLGNLVGLIDSDYIGPIQMSLWNRLPLNTLTIYSGTRIAQLVFVPIIKASFKVVDEFSINTKRGSGGFGSTGV